MLQCAQEIAEALQNERKWPELYRLHAHLPLAQSDFTAAQQLVSQALASAQKIQDRFEEGICQRIQAKIWVAQKQIEQAVIACQTSLRLLKGYDPYEIAQTQLILAQIYLETRSEQEEAQRLLQAAHSTFVRCQARREIEITQNLLQVHLGGLP
jgi:tetratricopeptide (TPR) repeat protein